MSRCKQLQLVPTSAEPSIKRCQSRLIVPEHAEDVVGDLSVRLDDRSEFLDGLDLPPAPAGRDNAQTIQVVINVPVRVPNVPDLHVEGLESLVPTDDDPPVSLLSVNLVLMNC